MTFFFKSVFIRKINFRVTFLESLNPAHTLIFHIEEVKNNVYYIPYLHLKRSSFVFLNFEI